MKEIFNFNMNWFRNLSLPFLIGILVIVLAMPDQARATVDNGDFSIGDPALQGYAWVLAGGAAITDGEGVLAEDGQAMLSSLEQTFSLAADITALKFTITAINLTTNMEGEPADAFEVRLIDTASGNSLVAPVSTLSGSDAFFNLQQSGELHYGSQVSIAGAGNSGDAWDPALPVIVTLDLSWLETATEVSLHFDLLGFDNATSSISIDTVRLVGPPPETTDDTVETDEDMPVAITVLENDLDSLGLLDHTTVTITTDPEHGTAVTDANGIITYTPAADYFGGDTFTYSLEDIDQNIIGPATVTVTVNPVNDPPVVVSTPVTAIDEDSPYSYLFAASDPDPGDTLTYSGLVLPVWLSFNTESGELSGLPTNNEVAAHTVVLRASDGTTSVDQSFTVTVANVNDAPQITNQSPLSIAEDSSIVIQLTDITVIDPDNVYPGTFMFTLQDGPNYSINGNTIIPDADFNGSLSVPITVNDGEADSAPFNLTVTVNPVPDPPTADAGGEQRVRELTTVTLDGSGSHDPDDDISSYLWQQTGGTQVTLSDATTVLPTFAAPAISTNEEVLTFSLTVTDSGNVQNVDTTGVTVTDVRVAGDINDDYQVDLVDSQLALQVVAGLAVNPPDIIRFNDIDGDGTIGGGEILFALQVTADLRPELFVDDDNDGLTEMQGDCDDTDPTIHPGVLDICGDSINQDCLPGESLCPEDIDDDNDNYTENQGDCDDTDNSINPGIIETCGDGIDQNCNGSDQECTPEYIDDDSDGYNEAQGDCDDTDNSIHPAATEICGDSIDQDCNGADLPCPEDIDDDSDGYTENQGDCDDTDNSIHPGAVETCGDGIDQDCSGADLICPEDIDDDNDGYTENQGDCDDTDNAVNPAAAEITYNGKDDDCDPATRDDDLDEDGYPQATDCDDDNATINPDAIEICGDTIDQDCDGSDAVCGPEYTDDDFDGVSEIEGDCDDTNPDIFPGNVEICDGLDNDCDNTTVDGSAEAWLSTSCDGTDADLCAEGIFECTGGNQVCSDFSGDNLDICDGVDNDCNAATADGADEPWLATSCDGPDSDLCSEGIFECTAGSQTCSDNTGDILDVCDGVDNDCNAATDDGADEAWLGDSCDGDDSDLCSEGIFECTAGSKTCSDNTADNLDLCDGEDNDCNAATADGADEAWLGNACDGADSDLCTEGIFECSAGAQVCGDTTNDTVEVCDGIDNDCDGDTDEGVTTTFYLDSDGDNYGDPGSSTEACEAPQGYVSNASDCNDDVAAVNPGVSETPYNGVDDDCDTATLDNDLDQDGYLLADDCDDNDNSLHATLTGYADSDNDTYTSGAGQQLCTNGTLPAGYLASPNGEDCNDNDASINPGATEICGDDIDQNCDGDNSIGFTADGTEAAEYDGAYEVLFYMAPSSDSVPRDNFEIEVWEAPGSTYPGTYTISPTDNYVNCSTCVLVYTNCDAAGICDKIFFANEGAVNVTAYGTVGGRFTGTVSNVTLQEVTIDEQTFVSTPVPGGDQWCIDSFSFDAPIAPPSN